MARVKGFYWVQTRRRRVLIALYRDEEWTFGDGEPFDDETNLDIVAGPLPPPSAEVAATWKQRYDEIFVPAKE